MALKELPNPERYVRVKGEKGSRDSYKDNPAYTRRIIANPFGPDDPRNLSLRLVCDAERGKKLELPDIELPVSSNSVEIDAEKKRLSRVARIIPSFNAPDVVRPIVDLPIKINPHQGNNSDGGMLEAAHERFERIVEVSGERPISEFEKVIGRMNFDFD